MLTLVVDVVGEVVVVKCGGVELWMECQISG